MAAVYYYPDPARPFHSSASLRAAENRALDWWFYPNKNYFEEVHKEAKKQQEEAEKKKKGDNKKDEKKDDKKDEKKDDKKEDKKEDKPKVQIIDLKVNLCCESCARRVKKKIEKLEGVEAVMCDICDKKVTVKGTAKPEAVLKQAQKVKKEAAMWPKKK